MAGPSRERAAGRPLLHNTEFAVPGGRRERELQIAARGPVFGLRGVIASGQPLASLAGIDILRAGGNAIDAAIAVSAAMAVVQPYSSHLGGDAFAMIRTAAGETAALNAGGRAPLAATPERYAGGIPRRGAAAVAVPGMVDAWFGLHDRFGSRRLDILLAPAVGLGRDGFAVSRGLASAIRASQDLLGGDPGCREVFLRDGPPPPGAVLRQPDLARTLEAIASGGRDTWRADAGGRIVSYLRDRDGLLAEDDLVETQAAWGTPLTVSYRDCTVYEQPLPSQGFLVLEALGILDGYTADGSPDDQALLSADTVHRTAEALRLAFADRNTHAGDPDVVKVPIERLLSKKHAAELRGRIGSQAGAAVPAAAGNDTTSFAVADAQGNLVSFIQSIFQPWGAAVLVPGTGVLLNDRMSGFSLDPASPNLLRPGVRTVHTLNTWLLDRDDGFVFAGGTPGADFQVQTNVQVITALVDGRLNAQQAIDAPKWALTSSGDLALEARFPQETLAELAKRGHTLERLPAWAPALCRSQLVGRDGAGGLLAASDPRAEGSALGC